MDSIRVKDDGLGDFGGVAHVTYTGANPAGGANFFTLTVFVGGKDVAVLNGSAEDVKPGTAETVQFISSDDFVGGPYKFRLPERSVAASPGAASATCRSSRRHARAAVVRRAAAR
jgi:hypothetical protein